MTKFKRGDIVKNVKKSNQRCPLIINNIYKINRVQTLIMPDSTWYQVVNMDVNDWFGESCFELLASYTDEPNRTINLPPGYTVNINGKTLTTDPPVVDTPVPHQTTFKPSFDPFTSMYGADDGSVYSGNSWESEITKGKPKCECGTTKTYGESAQSELHSSFCPLRKA